MTNIIRSPFLFSVVLALLIVAMAGALAQPAKQAIAHRGASGYAPEHTAAAYKLAMEQKVDFVEQDLGVTRDNELICIHDDTLERTTNVAKLFPDRASANVPSRTPGQHWLVNDFTMAEIKRLDAGKWFKPEFANARIQTFPGSDRSGAWESRYVSGVEIAAAVHRSRGIDRV